ncbi:TnsA-like heteromeric transposase endonuclease subunit [Streptomyces sp. NBC_01363]|uniref:TnsA-like heteromeric transposase endonuclease subunit n=1 Tax=Streptomyces sp. NBC_01363 TaxID=2903840 RepID=UPI0022593E37|nr:TnsA-like heteromeric transposase endonuclease subunit [Streptomyces sp. NBC_01363]MCX4734102.1 TnsA-like heteromeric transposase endonuclease subunit [Streptomyces sp. NBC_01363]
MSDQTVLRPAAPRLVCDTRPWSDVSALTDLACTHAIAGEAFAALVKPPDWTSRWTTAWRFGRKTVRFPVRALNEVDMLASVPVRRFTWRTDQWHRPGLEYLVSTERHHGFESFEEELLLLCADFSGVLLEALAQPFRLTFDTTGGRVDHTPDFLLLLRGVPLLIDVRPAHRIDVEDEVKFAASAEAALAAGWNYAVVTGWREHAVGLVDSFSAGRRALSDPLGLQPQLLSAAALGPLPFGDLVERCTLPAVGRAHAIHLLWHRRLGLDMSGPLRDASTVRLAPAKAPAGGRW